MHVDVTVRGPVPRELAGVARTKMAALERIVMAPVIVIEEVPEFEDHRAAHPLRHMCRMARDECRAGHLQCFGGRAHVRNRDRCHGGTQ